MFTAPELLLSECVGILPCEQFLDDEMITVHVLG